MNRRETTEGRMARLRKFRSKFLADESGISSVEYAVLLGMVTIGIILGAEEISKSVGGEMTRAADCVKATTSADCPK